MRLLESRQLVNRSSSAFAEPVLQFANSHRRWIGMNFSSIPVCGGTEIPSPFPLPRAIFPPPESPREVMIAKGQIRTAKEKKKPKAEGKEKQLSAWQASLKSAGPGSAGASA
ncbi:MAG: hypothetical protein WEB63_04585 [Cucumibacter sp.]